MTGREYRFVLVDVFTRRALGGNQLAVFTDARGLADDELQALAREMNFSETTFVLPPDDPAATARVRIFTPARELPFAGHPVVGTGFVLAAERGLSQLRLELQSGPLAVRATANDGRAGEAWMEQRVPAFRPAEPDDPAILAGLLGLGPDQLALETPPEFGTAGVEFLYLRLRSLAAVRGVRPDEGAFRRYFGQHDHPAVYLFSTETELPASASHGRMFSLTVRPGLSEDPATGGASGPLAAYLVRHGLASAGRLVLEQGFELQRPSLVEAELSLRDGQVSAVQVGGGVVKVAEGRLLL